MDLEGKWALVTGGNSGIGKYVPARTRKIWACTPLVLASELQSYPSGKRRDPFYRARRSFISSCFQAGQVD